MNKLKVFENIDLLVETIYYRPHGKVMFSQASIILSTIGLMPARSLLILVGYLVTAVGTHPTGMLTCAFYFQRN